MRRRHLSTLKLARALAALSVLSAGLAVYAPRASRQVDGRLWVTEAILAGYAVMFAWWSHRECIRVRRSRDVERRLRSFMGYPRVVTRQAHSLLLAEMGMVREDPPGVYRLVRPS